MTIPAAKIASGSRIEIVIPGNPIGKPRMTRRDKWAKRPCVVKYRDWCDLVRSIIGEVPPAAAVKTVSWIAWFDPPKRGARPAYGELHRAKPDRDNIDKAVLDCLWPDGDSAIAKGAIEKRWGAPARLEIIIELNP